MVVDSGCGFLAWRGTLLGAANYIILPDPRNIAEDTAEFLAMWSPGQYAVPGAISASGLPLGVAMILTAAISLAACLAGWLKLLKRFAPDSRSGPLLVALLGTFHFSTFPFGTYNGGEILSILLDPAHPIFSSDGALLWCIAPVALFMIALVSSWRPDTAAKAKLKSFPAL
jgi:hypothetical protein